MKSDHTNLFNRRGFLKSVALLSAAATCEVWSTSPAAAAIPTGGLLTSLAYCSDDGLVDASSLPSGDASLIRSGVRVTIENYALPDGLAPMFRGFVPVFIVRNGTQSDAVPFYAWGPTTPVKRSSFFMPAEPANGVLFSLVTNDPQYPTQSFYLAARGSAQVAKLRTGMYVIAAGSPSYAYVAPKTENGIARLVGRYDMAPFFEYLLINVAKPE